MVFKVLDAYALVILDVICHELMGMEISVHTGHSWVLRWAHAWVISLYINCSIEIINDQGATARYACIGMWVQFVRILSYFTCHRCNDMGCSRRYQFLKEHSMYGRHCSHAGIPGCSDIFIFGCLIFLFLGLISFPRATLTDTILVIFSVQHIPFKMIVGTIR